MKAKPPAPTGSRREPVIESYYPAGRYQTPRGERRLAYAVAIPPFGRMEVWGKGYATALLNAWRAGYHAAHAGEAQHGPTWHRYERSGNYAANLVRAYRAGWSVYHQERGGAVKP